MGLFSWINDLIIDYKLNKADKLAAEGNMSSLSSAIKLYAECLSKYPVDKLLKRFDSCSNVDNCFLLYKHFAAKNTKIGDKFTDLAIARIKKVGAGEKLSLLDSYYSVYASIKYIQQLLDKNDPSYSIFIQHFINKHEIFFSSGKAFKIFIQFVSQLSDDEAISVFEKVAKGYDVKEEFISKILSIIKSLKAEDRITWIDRALRFYVKEERLLSVKGDALIEIAKAQSVIDDCCATLQKVLDLGFDKKSNKTLKNAIELYVAQIDEYYKLGRVDDSRSLCDKLEVYDRQMILKYVSIQLNELSKIQSEKEKVDWLYNTKARTEAHIGRHQISDSKNILGQLNNKLNKCIFEYAISLEKASQYKSALEQYGLIKESDAKANLRYYICLLILGKAGSKEYSKIEQFLQSTKGNDSEKKDLAYRYALLLGQTGKIEDCISIINTYLPNETELLNICKDIIIQNAEKDLSEFNAKIVELENGTLPAKDAVALYKEVDSMVKKIEPLRKLTSKSIDNYKTTIKNYVISKAFDEEKYKNCFETLKSRFPNYLNDERSLRNIAIACLGMAESDMLDDSNYQLAISIWLTAIYRKHLFVTSLDYTSWDDPYTFTLKDALGNSEFDNSELPNNINLDEPDNSNISIREVQKSLIQRFESAISENQQFVSFFNDQKDAIDAIIDLNLDEKCYLVVPYLASINNNARNEIKQALDIDRNNKYDNWEEVIAAGALYGFADNEYGIYQSAKKTIDKCKAAINAGSINNAFKKTEINRIKTFDKLYGSFFSYIMTCFKKETNEKEFQVVFNEFVLICPAINDSNLNFVFTNFVNNHIISSINNGLMSFSQGRNLLNQLKNYDSNNSRLDKMISDLDAAETNRTLGDIIDKINTKKIQPCTALNQLCKLYYSNKNNARICENLVTLCNMCIMEYIIKGKKGKTSVENDLDKLVNNRSTTFKNQSLKLAQAREAILNSLPSDARIMIKNKEFGKLNENGIALAQGLEYLKKLSS